MKRNLLAAASIVALCTPIAAFADNTFTGSMTLGYSLGDVSADGSSQDVNVASFRADSRLIFSEALDMDLGFTALVVDLDGIPVDANIMAVDAALHYRFGGGWSVGAFVENGDLDIDGSLLGTIAAISPEHQSYGVTLGYAAANWDVEGFIGSTEIDPLDVVVDYSVTNVGVSGTYRPSDALTIGGHLTRSGISSGGTSTEAYSIGVGAFYDINEQFTVYGAVSKQWFDDFDVDADIVGTSIGVSYAMNDMMAFPATLSLELVRNSLSLDTPGPVVDADFDEIRFGVSIPLGGGKPARPLNSHAYQTIGGHHDVVSAILPLY